jgi:hypothetical protein
MLADARRVQLAPAAWLLLTFLAFAACWVLQFVRVPFDSFGEILAYMAGAAA